MPAKKARTEGLMIGELARRSGVKLETIRYYERIGMLAGPPRTGRGRRVYSQTDVGTFTFVRRAREFGFTIADVRTLLKIRAGGRASCAEARGMALKHLAFLDTRIADLTRRRQLLNHAITLCCGNADLPCPVIEMLDCAPQ